MAMARRLLFPSSLLHFVALLSVLNLFISHLSRSLVLADSHFEGFDSEDADPDTESDSDADILYPGSLRSPPLTHSDPEPTQTTPPDPIPNPTPTPAPSSRSPPSFEYWDEDEFEGLPVLEQTPPETPIITENATPSDPKSKPSPTPKPKLGPKSFTVEIVCGTFLIMFLINYFTGKRENESLALAWAAKFATRDSIFERNFSLLGVGEGDDSPLLLKEGQTVFKFYASGRRCCQGLLATMELKSRHDLISKLYNLVVPCKDEINFEVYMNEEAMDHVVFALARKKAAKTMQKEVRDLQKFAQMVGAPSGRKWVSEELAVVSESKEVAGDLITEGVLEQVGFGYFLFLIYGIFLLFCYVGFV
jgi:hypothetical protein